MKFLPLFKEKHRNIKHISKIFFKNEQYIFLSSKKYNHPIKTNIRDIKDQAILNIAINANVDIILTGDKDFLSLNINKPQIMTARDYFEKFMEK